MSSRTSTLSMMVVGAVWVVLLWGSTANAARHDLNFERYLPEEYYSKSSKKGKSYYGSKSSYYGSKSSGYYSNKASKKAKSCKSAKTSKNYYGYYDHCIETASPDGNITDVDTILIDADESKSYKSKGSKGSKGGYYSKSSKSKSCKSSKKSKDGECSDPTEPPTMAPTKVPPSPDPTWNATFPDAVDTGYLFFDEETKFAWYAYTAEVGDETASATIGKVCPMDIANKGKVIESLCIEIKAPKEWKTVTSTKIIATEACYGVTGAIFKLAVVVEDTTKVLSLNSLVGSRMLIYDIEVGSDTSPSSDDADSIIVDLAYQGWKSLYGESGINGQPSFSPDCKTVYATWVAPLSLDDVEEEVELVSSITIASSIESAKKAEEMWRLGTSGRLVGLTSTKDGKSLISATNVPEDDTLNSGGLVLLNAKTGKIEQSYVYPDNKEKLTHNAYTNPVMDNSGNSYHIDSLLGLVKFDADDLNDGPVWSALGAPIKVEDPVEVTMVVEKMAEEGKAEVEKEEVATRKLAPARPRDKDSKLIVEEEKVELKFTAYQPALDGDFATVVGCGISRHGDIDGVIALAANNGGNVWRKRFDGHHVVNVGSCSGITHDIVYGPSSKTFTEAGTAVYVARQNGIQALDTDSGNTLWSYTMHGHHGSTTFVVVSDELVIAANSGTVVGLRTVVPPPPTPSPAPNKITPAPFEPTRRPTRSPLATLPPINPVAPPTPPPSSASTRELSYAAAVLSALPLLLVLLQ